MKKYSSLAVIVCGTLAVMTMCHIGKKNTVYSFKNDYKTWHTRDCMMIEAYKKIERIKVVGDSTEKASFRILDKEVE